MTRYKRKAFLGTAIGMAGNVIGGAIDAAANRKKMKEMIRTQNYNNNLQNANNVVNDYSNNANNYDDSDYDKIEFRFGGNKYSDRIKVAKKYSCGGRGRRK